ncbi:hypothetical protein GQ43DRAFT_475574 [Delitschia confertaspora ATCC 74209]|uniref:Uncharacterized protein n=1 Tax=Delitschia confertaspora ATCC 74209 TaxID=1513339 RepID=A0A9P4JDE3_9PLEO|nr:hypothetical protein GQ43DRAFT_475574 [Delitschia confertaspora ATCC 74209]
MIHLALCLFALPTGLALPPLNAVKVESPAACLSCNNPTPTNNAFATVLPLDFSFTLTSAPTPSAAAISKFPVFSLDRTALFSSPSFPFSLSPTTTPTPSPLNASHHGTSSEAKIGIGISLGLVLFLLTCLGIWDVFYIRRRRKQQRMRAENMNLEMRREGAREGLERHPGGIVEEEKIVLESRVEVIFEDVEEEGHEEEGYERGREDGLEDGLDERGRGRSVRGRNGMSLGRRM